MKDVSITFRLKESEKKMLEEIAKKKDVPISQLVREAVRAQIQEVE